MSDEEKVKLIKTLIAHGWECGTDTNDAGFWKGIILAIECVVEE